jgi:hypothetical protein
MLMKIGTARAGETIVEDIESAEDATEAKSHVGATTRSVLPALSPGQVAHAPFFRKTKWHPRCRLLRKSVGELCIDPGLRRSAECLHDFGREQAMDVFTKPSSPAVSAKRPGVGDTASACTSSFYVRPSPSSSEFRTTLTSIRLLRKCLRRTASDRRS